MTFVFLPDSALLPLDRAFGLGIRFHTPRAFLPGLDGEACGGLGGKAFSSRGGDAGSGLALWGEGFLPF